MLFWKLIFLLIINQLTGYNTGFYKMECNLHLISAGVQEFRSSEMVAPGLPRVF